MEKVLISSCLIGEPVRYDGRSAKIESNVLERWVAEGRMVPVCAELSGGLIVPRSPAEIIGRNGFAVLDGFAVVLDIHGKERTQALVRGAHEVLETAQSLGIRIAVLKDGSPSCGRNFIHNGQFNGTKKRGEMGVTAALLVRNGVAVYSEYQIAEAEQFLIELESDRRRDHL
jgi:uncharacterized protein YbbK (DUF523 family)